MRNLTNGFIAGNSIPGPTNPNKQERGFSHFSDVFMVSALNGDGVSDIRVSKSSFIDTIHSY